MAKTKVSEFDAVASNNTDINSVNVAEGCPPSGINNAIREMASLLKKQEVGTDAMTSPDINGGTIDGATIGASSGVTIGVSDGTVSAPSIKFTSDTNTGIYRGGTDILKFVTAGTDAITINASQNTTFGSGSDTTLSIDSSSAFDASLTTDGSNQALNIIGTNNSSNGNVYIKTGGTGTPLARARFDPNGDISFYEDTGTTPKLFWDASAESLGIGVSSPATTLHIGDSDTAVNGTMRFGQNSTYYGFIQKVYATDKFDIGTNGSGQHISFTNNGSEAMRIDSSGNVLIGRTSELNDFGDGRTSLVLQGTGSQDYSTIQLGNNGTASNTQILGILAFYDGTENNARVQAIRATSTDSADLLFLTRPASGSLTERMRIDSSGNLLVGTTTSFNALNGRGDIVVGNGSSNGGMTIFTGSSNQGAITFADGTSGDQAYRGMVEYDHSTDSMAFKTAVTERMRIGANGHQYATSADTSLANLTLRKSAGDTIDYLQCRKTDNDLRIVLEGSGDVHNATGTFSAISDEKLKENIADASSQWDDIKNIRIRKFSLKSDKSSEANMIGVIAQELENVSPNLVKERIDRDPNTGEDLGTTTKIVKYSILHTKAVKALQEAMTRIEALETANTALEARITALENGV